MSIALAKSVYPCFSASRIHSIRNVYAVIQFSRINHQQTAVDWKLFLLPCPRCRHLKWSNKQIDSFSFCSTRSFGIISWKTVRRLSQKIFGCNQNNRRRAHTSRVFEHFQMIITFTSNYFIAVEVNKPASHSKSTKIHRMARGSFANVKSRSFTVQIYFVFNCDWMCYAFRFLFSPQTWRRIHSTLNDSDQPI